MSKIICLILLSIALCRCKKNNTTPSPLTGSPTPLSNLIITKMEYPNIIGYKWTYYIVDSIENNSILNVYYDTLTVTAKHQSIWDNNNFDPLDNDTGIVYHAFQKNTNVLDSFIVVEKQDTVSKSSIGHFCYDKIVFPLQLNNTWTFVGTDDTIKVVAQKPVYTPKSYYSQSLITSRYFNTIGGLEVYTKYYVPNVGLVRDREMQTNYFDYWRSITKVLCKTNF